MSKFKTKNLAAMLSAAFFLFASLILTNQTAFAGQNGCQTGEPVLPMCKDSNCERSCKFNPNLPACPTSNSREQRKFAAAQIKYEQSQPPSGGISGSDSPLRSGFSYFASIFILLGGIWLLVSLLRQRLNGNYAAKSSTRLAKIWNFALQPSFALSSFAFLFAAVIVGSALTSPAATSAQEKEGRKHDGRLNENSNSLNAPAAMTNEPVFKSAQVIGGDGVTQIGAPVFDADGNRYVRGGFSGTLTIGSTVLTATRDIDLFIAKYDANGNALWARQGSGLTTAPSADLAVEGASAMAYNSFFDEQQQQVVQSIYVAGSFVKTLTLQGGANPNITLNDDGAAGYNYETFVAKYDLNGNLLWARGGNSGSEKNPNNLEIGQNAINKIVFDNFGTPYVAGFISGNNFLGAPISNFTCSSDHPCGLHGKSDIVVAKLDQNTGAPTRVQVLGGSDNDNALDLAIDNATNPNSPKLYLVGNFSSPQMIFPVGASNQTFNNTTDSINAFVYKMESDNLNRTTIDGLWVNVLDNDGIVGVNQIATDAQTGQAFITGYFTGTMTGIPGPFGSSITSNRTGTGEAALSGYVASLDPSNGQFVRLAALGGAGNAIAVRSDGVIFIVGTLWDSGEFSANGITKTLDSFGGSDLYVAGINRDNFEFASLKAVAGTGFEGLVTVGNPTAANGATINKYSPFGVAFNDGRVYVSGDFSGTLSLDCITLTAPVTSRRAYIAEFLRFDETNSCRIWTNNEPSYRYWTEPNNWNGGKIPAANDSVYVPYRKYVQFNPIYNPSFYTPNSNVPLDNLSISANQTVVLQENLTVNNRLDLLGGFVDAGSNKITVGANGQIYNINGGRVLGKLEKQFSAATNSFTFPVGTANGYSPVSLSNIAGAGTFAVAANQDAYPNAATDLPSNRANRWWNLTNGGLTKADLTFQYVDGDIPTGMESEYRAYRILTGGAATYIGSNINTVSKTVTVPSVTEFSDWTLAQPAANALTITGTAVYGTTPVGQTAKVVRGVELSAVGTNSAVAAAAATDSGGSYLLGGLTPQRQYTVIPSKTGDIRGITPFDAVLILRCTAAGNNCQLTDNQKLAADTDNSGKVTPFDAVLILRYAAGNGQNGATGQVGNWKFTPPSVFYDTLDSSLSNENFTAILIGEVDGSWAANASAPAGNK